MAGMARSRPNPPVIHMLVAIAVVLFPALLAVAWFQRIPEPPINKVDPAPVVAEARAAGVYPVASAQNLPDGWVCTRARFTKAGQPGVGGDASVGNTLGLGYLSPQQLYFAIDERDAQPDAFVRDVARDGRQDGTSTVSGQTWQRWVSADGRTRSLSRDVDGRAVVVVSADASYEALEAFAGTVAVQG